MAAEGDERAGSRGEMDEGRVLALSDGVFAIAATLLVLDLRVPDGLDPARLRTALHELLPALGGYALSYVLIGLLWLGHHRLFRSFRQVSSRVARLNLLFLGTVSVLPFVTSLIARYGDQRLPVVLYAGTAAVVFVLQAAMGRVAHAAGDIADRAAARPLGMRSVAVAVVFLVSIPLAALPPHWAAAAAKYCWLLIIPARLLARLAARRGLARPAAPA